MPRTGTFYPPPPPAPPAVTSQPSWGTSSSGLSPVYVPPDYSNIPHTESTEYILAWKGAAYIDWRKTPPEFHGLFHGIYTVDAVAECGVSPGRHEAPDVNCCCGFYGVKDWHILDYDDRTAYYMEVEFYGTVVVCERGYRAQKQRILAVYCTEKGMIYGRQDIIDGDAITDEVLLAEMASRLGVEVRRAWDLPDETI